MSSLVSTDANSSLSTSFLCVLGNARLNGFSLSVGNSSKNYKVCYQDNTTDPGGPGDIIEGACNVAGPVLGDTVKIMTLSSPYLSLCEVEIFGRFPVLWCILLFDCIGVLHWLHAVPKENPRSSAVC